MSSPKLDQIGEQQAQKKAQDGSDCALDKQRNARGPRPGGVTYAGNLFEQARGLGLLKVITWSGKHQLPCQRAVMNVHVYAAGGIVSSEHLAGAPFYPGGETVGGAEWPVPDRRGDD